MLEEPDEQAFELPRMPTEQLFESNCSAASVARTADESSECESAENSQFTLWKTEQPQYCKAVADYYGKTARTVQITFHKILQGCPWVSEADLKVDERYTPLCIELMGDYWASGLKIDAWKFDVMQRYLDRVAAHASTPFILPAASVPTVDMDSNGSGREPIEGTLEEPVDLEPAPIVLSLDYLQNPDRMRQQLEQMYDLQRQSLANLQTTAQQLQHNAAHFEQATHLSDQLLIQQAIREGTELGITIARVRQEACRAAQHAVHTQIAEEAALGKSQGVPPLG